MPDTIEGSTIISVTTLYPTPDKWIGYRIRLSNGEELELAVANERGCCEIATFRSSHSLKEFTHKKIKKWGYTMDGEANRFKFMIDSAKQEYPIQTRSYAYVFYLIVYFETEDDQTLSLMVCNIHTGDYCNKARLSHIRPLVETVL